MGKGHIVAAAAAAVISFNAARAAEYSPEEITRILESARSISPVQPSDVLVKQIEHSVSDQGTEGDMIVRDHVPLFKYYSQKDSNRFILHPMRTGRFLLEGAKTDGIEITTKAVLDLALELPNGGLAWYYPRHYKVSRMLGEKLKYSAISQGTLIAGLASVAAAHGKPFDEARKAFLAMKWPFESGGVNLENLAVLEMPAFAGPPEIILNGWIDALLHIRDYGDMAADAEAISLFESNLDFMVKVLPNFDAPNANISRYSDLSPYRVKVTVSRPDEIDSLSLLYVPKLSGLHPIKVPLHRTPDPDNYSNYENQILRTNGRSAFVWLSCSQLYDTVLISKSPTLEIEMNSGEIKRHAAAPGLRGEPISISSTALEQGSYAVINADDRIICGYPTNFAKNGVENFYHSYHVVSLMLLAMGSHVTDQQRQSILGWAMRWLDVMHEIEEQENLTFRDPQAMLNAINGGKMHVTFTNFDDMLEAVREEMATFAARQDND